MRKTNRKQGLCAILSLFLMMTLIGCGKEADSPNSVKSFQPGQQAVAEEASSLFEDSTEQLPAEASAQSLTDFAVRLFQQSLEEEGNTLISPLSVISALGMTANGAEGDTLSQMEQVLGMESSQLNTYLHDYREGLPEKEGKYKLNMANAIWFKDTPGLVVEEEFLQTNTDYYDATVRKAPFDDSTLKDINDWVSDNTDEMIPTILDDIASEAVMYLINALSFDAEWQEIYYEHQVRNGEFTKEDGSKQDATLMYSEEYSYLEDEDAIGFMKYYADGKYAYVALLPNEEISVSEYVASLTGEKLHNILTNASDRKVKAAIPKYESEYEIEMSAVLASMGMESAFDMSTADFSGLGYSENGNLYIDKVIHKTFIGVDEKGTKAGAATAVVMVEGAAMEVEEPIRIYLDRPFVYMIVDCENNVTIFMGAMKDLQTTPEPSSVSLVMVGDILLHTPVEESARQEDGSYDFTAVFSETRDMIAAADLALVNQEVIIGGEELGISGYPAFNAPFAVGDALVEAGFDVVCHGTNHALDKGAKGLNSCLDFWADHYPEIGVLGIHGSQESQDSIYIYEQNDIRIAILNYTYGTNGISLPADMPYAVDLLEKDRVVADIAKAEEMADFTIVCPHWGTEYELGISSMQEKWTQIFLENGVDLVLGTHPHVIEPIEWVEDEESGHKMLVYYSLGNFVNWTSGTGTGVANRMMGGMAQVTLEKDENNEVSICEYGIEPLVCHLQEGRNGVTVYPLEEYTAEMAEVNAIVKQDATFSLDYCKQLCNEVWDLP